jgi:hypothetical protein
LELGLLSTQSVLPGVKSADISTFDRSVILERARNLLEPKRDHLISQFGRIGLNSRQLKTQELIQLFYTIYNPEASDGQKMTDSNNYTTSLVEGNIEETVFGPNRSQTPDSMQRTHNVQSPMTPAPAPQQFIPAQPAPVPAAPPAQEFTQPPTFTPQAFTQPIAAPQTQVAPSIIAPPMVAPPFQPNDVPPQPENLPPVAEIN